MFKIHINTFQIIKTDAQKFFSKETISLKHAVLVQKSSIVLIKIIFNHMYKLHYIFQL